MASPAIAGTPATTEGASSATPVVNLPANIAAGETLLVLFRAGLASSTGVAWPDAGWVELFDASPDAVDDQTALAWRKAVGDEGSSITLGISNAAKFAAVSWRISGAADPTVTPPQLSTVAVGTDPNQPDPTTVTPTGGSKDYLFGAICGMAGEATSPPTYPTGYTLGQAAADSGTAGLPATNVRVAGAWKQATAASDDPGAFTYDVLLPWLAYAVAVHPSTSVAHTATPDDSLSLADARALTQAKELSDTFAMSDSLTRAMEIVRAVATDLVALADQATPNLEEGTGNEPFPVEVAMSL